MSREQAVSGVTPECSGSSSDIERCDNARQRRVKHPTGAKAKRPQLQLFLPLVWPPAKQPLSAPSSAFDKARNHRLSISAPLPEVVHEISSHNCVILLWDTNRGERCRRAGWNRSPK